jgi:acylphosphatase
MTAAASPAARRFLVRGRVQGVGFRWSAVAEGNRLGLGGWARSLADGRVEVHAQGDPEAVEALAAWLRRGPLGAEVASVDGVPAEPEPGLRAFEFRG